MIPPKALDGATVVAAADLALTSATGSVRHFRGAALQESDKFFYLALATYEGDRGWYVFYCDQTWAVLNDLLFDSRQEAEQHVGREFVGVEFIDV